MKTLLKFAILPILIAAMAGCEELIDPPPFTKVELPPAPPPGPIKPVEPLANPERGYHLEEIYFAHKIIKSEGHYEWEDPETRFNLSETEGQFGYDTSIKLTQLYIYLWEWADEDLPKVAFDHIQEVFDLIRAGGYKVILRFAYNKGMDMDERIDNAATIRRHLGQLKPIIQENMGLIATMQAGFIGAWGEWHSSAIPEGDQKTLTDDIVNSLLAMFPAPRGVQVRELHRKDAVKLTDPADYKRIGLHSDFFTTGLDPIDHMSVPGKEYNTIKQQSPYFYMLGEIPYVDDQYGFARLMNIGKVAEVLRDQHFSAFDITQNYELNILNWKSQKVYPTLLDANRILYDESYFLNGSTTVNRSFYEFVRDHLGYRINAKEVGVAYADGSVTCSVTLTNTGFAAPMNPRQIHLVLIDADGNMAHQSEIDDTDPLSWQPYDPDSGNYKVLQHTISAAAAVSVPAGQYKVGIWMPDPLNKGLDGLYDMLWAPGEHVTHWTADPQKRYRVNIIGMVNI